MKISGVVEKVYSTKLETGVVLYSLRLSGMDSWYRCGEHRPSVDVGDLVDLDINEANRVRKCVAVRQDTSTPERGDIRRLVNFVKEQGFDADLCIEWLKRAPRHQVVEQES
jgi:hypothetical protein